MSGLDLYLSQRTLAMMFVYAAIAGFCLGGVYDVLRILRILFGDTAARPVTGHPAAEGQGRRPVLLTVLLFFEDVIFMLVAAVTLILLCYYTNDGQLRAPAVMGMACGFFVYWHTLGRLVTRLAEALVTWLRRLLRAALRVLLWPLKQLARLLSLALARLWQVTVGRIAAARRERETKRQIAALTDAAARGFGVLPTVMPEASGQEGEKNQ